MNDLSLSISPKSLLPTEPLSVVLRGLKAKQVATITLKTTPNTNTIWQCHFKYQANDKGVIDLNQQTPINHRDKNHPITKPMDLLMWLRPARSKDLYDLIGANASLEPFDIHITVTIDKKTVAEDHFQIMYHKAIDIQALERPLVGTFYTPKDAKTNKALICLGGSSGDIPHITAALLASHGYPALALGYFSQAGLPDKCIEIPIETVAQAQRWLLGQDHIKTTGVLGISKGAELALVSACHYPLNPILLISPSSYVFQGLGDYRHAKSSWSHQGKEMPFVPIKMKFFELMTFLVKMMLKRPHRFVKTYQRSMRMTDSKTLNLAHIPIDQTQGPLCLFSGNKDQVWPSYAMCKQIESHLKDTVPVTHHHYQNVGHLSQRSLPYFPTPPIVGKEFRLDFGGNIMANSKANIQMWEDLLAFLSQHMPTKP